MAGIDYLALGHLTVDVDSRARRALGGSVLYAAGAASGLGLSAAIVTRAGSEVRRLGLGPDVQVHSGEASGTTVFGHGYDSSGARELTLLDRAPDLSPDDVPEEWRRVGVLHVAPVMAEVSADVVSAVRADFVGVTAQGWLRRVGADGRVAAGPWAVPEEIVRRSDAVVVSDEDLRGSPSLSSGLAALAETGPVVVLTHGAEGATAWHAGRVWRQAACPARAVDPTGAGDTFAAALFVRLWEGADLRAALGFAAAAAAFAVETRGAGGLPARNRIERRGSEAPASGPATATEGGAAGC